jgi:acyl dehydratase
MRLFTGASEVEAAAGAELGVSEYLEVTQHAVDAFAEATGDNQWIHVDPVRASKSQFRGTIAHGFFTLSLAPKLQDQVFRFEGFDFGMNYGLNRVRFPSPLPVGSRVRVRVSLGKVQRIPGGLHLVLVEVFEREGSEKPVCVAELIVRLYGGAS